MSIVSGCSEKVLLKPLSDLSLKLGSTLSGVETNPKDVAKRFRVIKKDGETVVELAGEINGKKLKTEVDLATSLSCDRFQQLRYLVELRGELRSFCLQVDSLLSDIVARTGPIEVEGLDNMETVSEFLKTNPHFKSRRHFAAYPKMTERELETVIYRLLYLYALFG